jgi:hypothetical protein
MPRELRVIDLRKVKDDSDKTIKADWMAEIDTQIEELETKKDEIDDEISCLENQIESLEDDKTSLECDSSCYEKEIERLEKLKEIGPLSNFTELQSKLTSDKHQVKFDLEYETCNSH